MSTQESHEFKETVRARTDLVALIGESIALQSRSGGREFAGICPFHDDHDPSLRVYPDRQTYKCWVCQAGGDCFTWVMEHDRVSFRDGLELLARRANVPIPTREHRGPPQPSDGERAALLDVLAWAQNLFHQTLLQSPAAAEARKYLQQRKLTAETIRQFQLGYHPNDWDWLQRQARGKYAPQLLLAARLIGERTGGNGYFDNFVDRVLFPICNERGQPVAFGGRVLPGGDETHGKYWNSPESVVFQKSRLVYGLNHAREAIHRDKTAVVVEGYTDCIIAHQHGLKNVVGTLGTALTDLHVTTIKRFAPRVVLVYDGDDAGQRAADRSVGRFLAHDVDLRVLTLPDGLDPADYLERHAPETLQQLIAAAPEGWEFKFAAARARHGIDSVVGRQRVLEEMLQVLATVPHMSANIRESLLLGQLASRTGASEAQLRERYKALRSAAQHGGSQSPGPAPAHASESIARLTAGRSTRLDRAECELLEILCIRPDLLPHVRSVVPGELIEHPALRRLLELCYFLDSEAGLTFERLMSAIEDSELKRLAVWIDDQARLKTIEIKLRESAESSDDCPPFLRRAIDHLNWRREEQSHGRTAAELSAHADGAQRMDATAEALLRRSLEFHQRRATRKAPV